MPFRVLFSLCRLFWIVSFPFHLSGKQSLHFPFNGSFACVFNLEK